MLLKRNEKDGIVKALYESSNILASTYDKEKEQLVIAFGSGIGYQYENVTQKEYAMFELADSQGVAFNKNLRKHTYKAIGEIDVEAIKDELKASKNDEMRIINEDILATAKEVVNGEAINEYALDNLVKLYNARKIKLANE